MSMILPKLSFHAVQTHYEHICDFFISINKLITREFIRPRDKLTLMSSFTILIK